MFLMLWCWKILQEVEVVTSDIPLLGLWINHLYVGEGGGQDMPSNQLLPEALLDSGKMKKK